MRRKIIFLIWQDKPGGIEVLLPQIIKNFPDLNFEAFVFRPQRGDIPSIFDTTNIRVTYGSNHNIFLLFILIRFLAKNKNQIFHGFNLGPFIFLTLKLFRVKNIIYSIHGTVYWKDTFKKILFKLLWHLSVNQNDCFISNSNYSKNVFKLKISNKPDIQVIYNPIDTTRFVFKEKKITSGHGFKICYVGRLVNGKNLSLWIDIAEYILSYYPDSEFALYGTGTLEKDLNAMIINKGHEEKVKLKGFHGHIQNAYYENDLMLFLSEYESFGNVVVESILCGTPVIASKIPSIEEIFNNYPQFMVPLDANLHANIVEKLRNYEKLKEITREAALVFKERFSFENHIAQLTKIYDKFYS